MQGIQYIDRKTGALCEERPPAEKYIRFLYQSPLGKLPLELLVRRKFLSAWYGRQMDKEKSSKKIADFVAAYHIDMSEALRSVEEFENFNAFFCRKLHPSARPIGEGLVSPADGKLLAFEHIDELRAFFVKGQAFNLKRFLGNEALAERYAKGSLLIIRLAPHDYHRYHFPYAGQAEEAQQILGRYYSVSPYALARNFVKVFCENKRAYSILKTADRGDILLAPVGATMVGSIHFSYPPNARLEKGQEMGYFAFGGSTVVMLLEPGQFELSADLLENSRRGMETAVRMGEQIGE